MKYNKEGYIKTKWYIYIQIYIYIYIYIEIYIYIFTCFVDFEETFHTVKPGLLVETLRRFWVDGADIRLLGAKSGSKSG